jgi:hypothetical protein
MSNYHSELLRSEVCKTYQRREGGGSSSGAADPSNIIIQLNIGDFCELIEESFAVEIANDSVQAVRLIIDSAELIAPETVALLAKYVAPKITELTVVNCPKLSWKAHLKPIMECARGLEIVNLQKNKWVDDAVVDQVTLKFTKSLKELNLENTRYVFCCTIVVPSFPV